MSTRSATAAALLGPFVSEATMRGMRPPLRLLDQGTHGWPLAERHGETLVVDEYGDLWWSRSVRAFEVRVLRSCWPEEFRSMHIDIERSIDRFLGEDPSPR